MKIKSESTKTPLSISNMFPAQTHPFEKQAILRDKKRYST
jgi:hypothetical protein